MVVPRILMVIGQPSGSQNPFSLFEPLQNHRPKDTETGCQQWQHTDNTHVHDRKIVKGQKGGLQVAAGEAGHQRADNDTGKHRETAHAVDVLPVKDLFDCNQITGSVFKCFGLVHNQIPLKIG